MSRNGTIAKSRQVRDDKGMWLIRACAVLALLTLPCAAQTRLTVQQLQSFIESSVKLKHPDKQVAEYLKKVKLSEQLDDNTIESWLAKGIGPRTVEVLKSLADDAKDLPKAAGPAVKAPPVVIPPPSAEEMRNALEETKKYALGYSKRLPDFICAQMTRRYFDPSGLEFWRQLDTIVEKLTYFEQKEDYKVVTVNGRITDIGHDKLDGASSSGEFGSLLLQVFEPETQTEFRWERWTTLRGRRNHVFAYRVAQPNSKWGIEYHRSMRIVPGYRGYVYVDADYFTVTRITLEAIDIPVSFPIQSAKTQLDYDFIKIGDSEHVLPLRAEVRMREGKNLTKNEVEFRLYRKFGADATIKFEGIDPLPEDTNKETPVKPPANVKPPIK